MQVSVLPLEVYNDVEQVAVPALTARHMVAEAEADAEMCLRKLITNLAAEVWPKIPSLKPTFMNMYTQMWSTRRRAEPRQAMPFLVPP